MSNVATRLLSLILLLQSRPGWKASELAGELDVSERTVHRYIAMLEEMSIPVYSTRGPAGGFSLVRGYKMPPLLFTAEEATVLYMGANLVRELWGRTYEEAVRSVTAKLDNVLPDDLRHEVAQARQRLVVGALHPPDYRAWEPMVHALRQCIVRRRCARLYYRGLRGEDTERVVEPLALALEWGVWYLVAHCRLRNELRTFRVERIQRIVPLEEGFDTPEDLDVHGYLLRSLNFERPLPVTVRVEACIAERVRQQHGNWMQLSQQPDGSLLACFRVADLDWATGWVLSEGSAVLALEPPELVERVRAAAADILARYSPDAP